MNKVYLKRRTGTSILLRLGVCFIFSFENGEPLLINVLIIYFYFKYFSY